MGVFNLATTVQEALKEREGTNGRETSLKAAAGT